VPPPAAQSNSPFRRRSTAPTHDNAKSQAASKSAAARNSPGKQQDMQRYAHCLSCRFPSPSESSRIRWIDASIPTAEMTRLTIRLIKKLRTTFLDTQNRVPENV
jgi:hypothetical protein